MYVSQPIWELLYNAPEIFILGIETYTFFLVPVENKYNNRIQYVEIIGKNTWS